MQKIVQVHMLPTDKPSPNIILLKDKTEFKLFDQQFYDIWRAHQEFGDFSPKNAVYQHLYFTSEEEIKEGEHGIYNNEIGTRKNNSFVVYNCPRDSNYPIPKWENSRKIVATTNPELWSSRRGYSDEGRKKILTIPNLPSELPEDFYEHEVKCAKIPLSFVKSYVEKQGNIKEVKLEYNTYPISPNGNVIGTDRPYPYEGLQSNHTIEYSLKLDSQGCVIISPIEHTWGTLWTAWCEYQEIHKTKYIGQFLEWMENNYHAPVKK